MLDSFLLEKELLIIDAKYNWTEFKIIIKAEL